VHAFGESDCEREKNLPEMLELMAHPPRGPLRPLVEFLKTYPPDNVKELIARRLASGVFYSDNSEVLYWATVQLLVFETPLEADVAAETLRELQNLGCYA